jgi:hypothetical protein
MSHRCTGQNCDHCRTGFALFEAEAEIERRGNLLERIVLAWEADEIGQIDGALIDEARKLMGMDAAADPLATGGTQS